MVTGINTQNFDKEIKHSDKPILIDVYAKWCGPCQHMEPIIEELAKELGHQYKFAKLDVDEAREIAIAYGITSVPSFLFIKNNTVLAKEIGYMSKDVLERKLKEILG